MASGKRLRPGQPAPNSGQYRIGGTSEERTGVRGKPLPPTPKSGQGYTLVDPTNNGSGRGKK